MSQQFALSSQTGQWTITATILASSMAFIDSTALNVILPSLQQDLSATGSDLFWVLNSYLLMLAALIILGGSLGDQFGRIKIFQVGITIFTIGSISCGISPNIDILILSRGLQGIGGALMIPGSLSIIASTIISEEKGKAIGTWSAITTVVTICGPLLGGLLGDLGLWRVIFYVNVPLGIASFLILQFKVPESKSDETKRIDWLGAFTLVLGLTLLTLGFLQMPELGFKHWFIWTALIAGTGLLITFLIIERYATNPMVPLSMFRSKTFTGVNLLTFFLYASLGGITLFLSLNIIQIQQYSQLQAGLTFLPFSLVMMLLARRMGALADKYGARNLLIIGPATAAIGVFWIGQIGETNGPEEYWTTYFPGFITFAIGLAITVVPLTTVVMSCLGEQKSGIASGINNSVTRISGTFINAVLGAVGLALFSQFITQSPEFLNLPDDMQHLVLEEVKNFGEATAPDVLAAEQKEVINHLFKQAFLKVYNIVGIICGALAGLSAVIAFLTIGKKKKQD